MTEQSKEKEMRELGYFAVLSNQEYVQELIED